MTTPWRDRRPLSPDRHIHRDDLRRSRRGRRHRRRAQRARHRGRVPHPGTDHPPRPLGPGHHRPGQDRNGQDVRLRHPVVQRLGADPAHGVKALIVVPTRELAVQVYEDMDMLTQNRATSVVAIYGGKAYEGQIEQLKAGAQIVVGTPVDSSTSGVSDFSTCPTRRRSCSMRPTRCSTSASSPTSRRSSRRCPRYGTRSCSAPRCRDPSSPGPPLHVEPHPHARERSRRGPDPGEHPPPRLPGALARQGRGHRAHPPGGGTRQDGHLHPDQARRAEAHRRARGSRVQHCGGARRHEPGGARALHGSVQGGEEGRAHRDRCRGPRDRRR